MTGHALDDRGWRGAVDDSRTLFDAAQEAEMVDPTTIEGRFLAFHQAHPEVYEELRDLALALAAEGWTHFGVSTCWEVLRYRTMLGAKPEEDRFKLNDNYKSRYARLLADQVPALREVFELRALRSAARLPLLGTVCGSCGNGHCRNCHTSDCGHECDLAAIL